MEHPKTFFQELFHFDNKELFLEGPLQPEVIANYTLHPNLTSFRPVQAQKKSIG